MSVTSRPTLDTGRGTTTSPKLPQPCQPTESCEGPSWLSSHHCPQEPLPKPGSFTQHRSTEQLLCVQCGGAGNRGTKTGILTAAMTVCPPSPAAPGWAPGDREVPLAPSDVLLCSKVPAQRSWAPHPCEFLRLVCLLSPDACQLVPGTTSFYTLVFSSLLDFHLLRPGPSPALLCICHNT